MFLINDIPAQCPHCGADIPRQQVEEDFYAGALLTCAECDATYRYGTTEALTSMKRAEPPAPAKKKTFCVTCTQALPSGQEHPKFFGQNLLTPDLTAVHDLHAELAFLLSDIGALLNVLYDRESDQHENQGIP